MFNIFSKPPPRKLWIEKPAWITIVISLIVIFVLGPAGVIYNGIAEEQKQHKDAIVQNQLAIKELLTRQQLILDRKLVITPPSNLKIEKKEINEPNTTKKPVLTPEQFEKYLSMKPEIKVKYKKYLESRGYDIEGLP
jgi:hypothetical protein